MKRSMTQMFGGLRGLITVPGSIALILWAMAWPALQLDHLVPLTGEGWLDRLLGVSRETALAVLGTISSAAITTLSLVYSIVLVVFTLAAGNLAPRLLHRFTTDRVNQITAGLLGGTYLFTLTVLHQTDSAFVPSIATAIAVGLAAVTVLQLIFFMHTVSRSVTIDEEIAEISERLQQRLDRIVADSGEGVDADLDGEEDWIELDAPKPGYLSEVDIEAIMKAAIDGDAVVCFTAKPGGFLLEGQPFASYLPGDLDEDGRSGFESTILDSVSFDPSRGSKDDIEYSVNLLVEIALRALSPGTNDTYTAIACVDRLSAAFRNIVRRGMRSQTEKDDDGKPRIIFREVNVGDLLSTAFNPIRRAAADNALLLQNLGDALARLHAIARPEVRHMLVNHIRLIVQEFEATEPLPHDLEVLRKRFAVLLTERAKKNRT